MSEYRVVWSPQARAMADAALRGLQESGRAELLGHEIEKAVGLLARFPRMGTPDRARPVVRKLLLRRTQHYIYYLADDERREVQVVAIWHTARGRRPPIL